MIRFSDTYWDFESLGDDSARRLSLVARLAPRCASPAAHLLDLWAFLGLEGHDAATAAAAAKSVRPDPNAKHKAEYCGPLVAGDAAAVAQHDFLSSHFGDQIERDHNYTIRDWC